jgi:hypothetical protein
MSMKEQVSASVDFSYFRVLKPYAVGVSTSRQPLSLELLPDPHYWVFSLVSMEFTSKPVVILKEDESTTGS